MCTTGHYSAKVRSMIYHASRLEAELREIAQIAPGHALQSDTKRLYLALTLITDKLEELFPKE